MLGSRILLSNNRLVSAVPAVGGYLLWLDAQNVNGNNTNPANNTAISSWVDRATGNNALQATGGNQPTFKTNIQNGRPGVFFNGSTTSMSGNVITSNLTHTMIVCGYTLANAAYSFLINGDSQTDGYGMGYYNPGTKQNGLRYFGAPGDKYSGVATLVPYIATGGWDGSTSFYYVNNTQETLTNATAAPITPTSDYIIGNVVLNNNTKLNGYIFEILFYPTALNSVQILSNVSYLRAKWGI